MPLIPADLRALRDELGLTQAALADLVGVESNSVARWERGAVQVPEPAARLIKLLAVLAADERKTRRPADPLSTVAHRTETTSMLAKLVTGTRDEAHAGLEKLRKRGRRGRV